VTLVGAHGYLVKDNDDQCISLIVKSFMSGDNSHKTEDGFNLKSLDFFKGKSLYNFINLKIKKR